MSNTTDMEIKRHSQGYYSLFLNGRFEGNYDTQMEAVEAYEQIASGFAGE